MLRPCFFASLFLILSGLAFAQSQAVLRSGGDVKLNGVPVSPSTVVMDGDRIDTGEHSSAFVILLGRMISIGEGSSVLYKDGSVIPRSGAAKITTAVCQGSNCTTTSVQLGSGPIKNALSLPSSTKKCMSPKKPDKDHDCDND